MHKLTNWTARRSGAAISIKGRDADGTERRFTTTSIDRTYDCGVFAIDKASGETIALA